MDILLWLLRAAAVVVFVLWLLNVSGIFANAISTREMIGIIVIVIVILVILHVLAGGLPASPR